MRRRKLQNLARELQFLSRLSREEEQKAEHRWKQDKKDWPSVLLVDKRCTIKFYSDSSRSFSRLFDIDGLEAGRSFFDCVSESRAGILRAGLDQAMLGESHSRVQSIEVPGGSRHWYSIYSHPLCGEPGEVNGVCLAVQDITDRKRHERITVAMDNAFRFSSSAIAFFDFDGIVTQVNPAFLKLWKYGSEEETSGRSITDFLKITSTLQGCIDSLLREGTLQQECRGFDREGNCLYMEVVASVVRDEQGEPACLMVSAVDISRLKKAEEALKESERRFRCLVENQNDLLVECNSEWILEYVNPNYLELLGKRKEDLLGKSFFPLIHKKDLDRIKVSLERLKEPPHQCNHEERALTTLGYRWLSWSNRAVVDDNGEIMKVIAVGRDVTDQKETEEALYSSYAELETLNRKITRHDNFLQALLDSIPVPVFYKDSDLRYLGCNKAFTGFMGISVSELEGKTAGEIWPRDYSETFARKDRELLENQVEQRYEFQVKTAAGDLRDIIYFKNVFLDEKGELGGIVGAFSDITDLKKAEASLRLREENFRMFFEKAPIGYQSLDEEGNLQIVNQTWLGILGYKKKDVLGKPFLRVVSENSQEEFKENFNRLKGEGRLSGAEFQLKKQDGEIVDVSYSGTVLRDAQGSFLKTQCVFIDITKSKEILRVMQRVAGQAKGLRGYIPICAGCRRIQDIDKKGSPWVIPEKYISERLPEIRFSHGMCPDCIRKWYPDYEK